jgi:translation initiation factor IF-3
MLGFLKKLFVGETAEKKAEVPYKIELVPAGTEAAIATPVVATAPTSEELKAVADAMDAIHDTDKPAKAPAKPKAESKPKAPVKPKAPAKPKTEPKPKTPAEPKPKAPRKTAVK